MLTFEEKISFLIENLNEKSDNYADTFKTDIFFFIGEFSAKNPFLKFLHPLEKQRDIRNFINFLTGKIVMNEDQADISDIIADFIVH
jgi:hypothetical protein